MNRIFADTLFWGALIYPRDQDHSRAAAFARLRRDANLVTTEEILAEFLDKGYSLVDCVPMNTMRRRGITEILTSDRHFTQEGFRILLG